MVIEKLTYQVFKENCSDSISKNIEFAQSFCPEYPKHPAKPNLPVKHTAKEAMTYAREMQEYENDISLWKQNKSKYDNEKCRIDLIIEDYIKDEAAFNTVPEKSKSKVWDQAWSSGHSCGYYEVYLHLCNLVELF